MAMLRSRMENVVRTSIQKSRTMTMSSPRAIPLLARNLGSTLRQLHHHHHLAPQSPRPKLSPCQLSTFNLRTMATEPPRWQQIAWQKRDEQYSRIPTEWLLKSSPPPDTRTYVDIPRKCGILTKEELRITEEYDATALAEAIRKRELKCVDVTRAFCKVRGCFLCTDFLSTLIASGIDMGL